MAQDPSEDDVNMLLTVSEMQVDRAQAIQILKVHAFPRHDAASH